MLDYDQIMPIVKSVAAQVSSKFPTYIQSDDTVGALLLWTYQNRSTLERIIADGAGWDAKISAMYRKVAFDHCNSEKAASEGYDPTDVYKYSIEKIKTLIADAIDHENWQSFSASDKVGTSSKPLSYGDRVTELIDIKSALEKLNDDSYNILVYQYKYEYTLAEIGEELGITQEAAKKRAQRALKGLRKQLGYKDAQPEYQGGRRPVKTNAAWRADLSTSYEG
jgi:RNA polymerase sigma factor (sigma-70 family)